MTLVGITWQCSEVYYFELPTLCKPRLAFHVILSVFQSRFLTLANALLPIWNKPCQSYLRRTAEVSFGPTTFSIFINGINESITHCNFLLYANDCRLLQNYLYALSEFCNKTKLNLNLSKCLQITLSRNYFLIIYSYSNI